MLSTAGPAPGEEQEDAQPQVCAPEAPWQETSRFLKDKSPGPMCPPAGPVEQAPRLLSSGTGTGDRTCSLLGTAQQASLE